MLKEFPLDHYFIRLGGMHTLMNFIGAIGTLMAGTGLSDILSSTFAGAERMLQGKKYPQCLRALRMVVEVILEPLLQLDRVNCHQDLMQVLEERARDSKTSKLWLDCLLKPVFLAMDFIRAEREGDFPLHVATLKEMHQYYFAAGRANYARGVAAYMMNIGNLPATIVKGFLEGNHVMRYQRGIWNGISSDMFIESTFMRFGHSKTGIVGSTLKQETTKVWALSRHVCGKLLLDLNELKGDGKETVQLKHKEEANGRITSDKKDREGIRTKVKDCIHPFDTPSHPDELVNVSTGRISLEKVNVHMAKELSQEQASEFQKSLPGGFWTPIKRQVRTMTDTKKSSRVLPNEQVDTELIYSRALALQATSRNIDAKALFSHELAPYPLSMFDDSGDMRLCSSKSDLKNKTQVAMTGNSIGSLDCLVLDGCAILWVVQWPSSSLHQKALVKDFVDSFQSYILNKLQDTEVYLVFDRYIEYSTKGATRRARGAGGCKNYKLSYLSPLPTQTQVLNNPQNKMQLIAIIIEKLKEGLKDEHDFHKLVVTGQDSCPLELYKGLCIQRQDLANNHEEADVVVASQAMYAASTESKTVGVLADDTDIYVVLLYHYKGLKLTSKMFMVPTKQGRIVTDIKLTAEHLGNLCLQLLPAHALTGCDQVCTYYGIGKAKMLKVVKDSKTLSLLGNLDANFEDVLKEATDFMSACYGTSASEMTKARIKAWNTRTLKKNSKKGLSTLRTTSNNCRIY